MKALYTGAAVFALMGSAAVVAEENTEETPPWEVSAEVGAINTTGNTETTSFNGKIDATQNLTHWKNQYVVSALYKEDMVEDDDGVENKESTAEKYFASAKAAYLLTGDHGNLYGFSSFTLDEFGAYRKYTVLSFGYGNRLIDREKLTLDYEVGPGYYWGDKVEDEDLNIISHEEGFMVRGGMDLKWTINENATFTQKFTAEAGDDNSRYQSDTALSTKINGSLQMKVGYNVSHDTVVADDKENTDTTTYINLVYSF